MSATRPPNLDDRFSTPIEASRRGAHRARPKPASAGLPVVAGVAVVLLVLGGGYTVLKGSGSDSSQTAALPINDDAEATSTTATPKASAPAAGETTKPAADPAGPTKAATATVDRDVRLKVLNSTTIKGLALKVRANLITDGWKVAAEDTGNSINKGLITTKIYYGRAGTKATALALKKDLGFGVIVRDASTLTGSNLTTSDLAVVLGTDAG
jgi:hypothetical protein